MLSSCIFTQWGIDIVGRFPIATGQKKFLLVAIDYFTKWVEAEPLACITEGEVMKFIWKNIVCCFGIPREIISDNGRQFQGRRIQKWCQGLHIKQRFTSVPHPQSNGQVEVTNRILVQGIKRRLERVGGNWTEELTSALWAYRTTSRGSRGESPFSLVYGTDAIIPAELGMPSHRVMNFSEERNKDLLKEILDLIDELREKAFIRIQRYKNTMIHSYNKKVRARSFQVGDLVLRRVDTLKPVGKLDPTWERPYKITGIIGRGAYELEDLEGRPLPRQVEVTNRILVQGITKRLERVGENWTEELTSVLWAYKTTPRGSMEESPFSLVYGTEAIIPAELGIPSHRVMHFSEECNSYLLKESLDLIEQLREKAFIHTQRYKNIMINSYNKRVKAWSFQVGDLVLQRVDTLKQVGKLDPTWEGPYKITGIIGRGPMN
ncbi:UNVERIFIED_CONTAM: hypothetical protein Slati_4545300 [Sesamum latifolium]|uniref:Integrase catalytic domain-containing protein n=1 Tax=Sesamum latifolium TaxID=2727402 RepID=A0AAW2S2F7_9LAMI